ncbi:MAG: DNA alkylation repair protein [bacterium]
MKKSNVDSVIQKLKSMANSKELAGMARYGMSLTNRLGISMWEIRKIAKEIESDHQLAVELWRTGYQEARMLASFIDIPAEVTEGQMEEWAAEFDTWDVCDQVSTGLFEQTRFTKKKIKEWAKRDEEYVKRSAFAIIAGQAVHDKTSNDEVFENYFPLIKKAATDERNYVKKAVSWALRNIGKRNSSLNSAVLKFANDLKTSESKSARWIANDTIKDITSDATKRKFERKKN